MRNFFGASVLAAVVSLGAPAARGDLLTLTPAQDTSIFSDNDNSLGRGTSMYVGRTNGTPLRRALLEFDLSTVPVGAAVSAVTLKLHVNKAGPGPAEMVVLHRLLDDWGEGTSGVGVINGGMGSAPTVDSATWHHRFFSTVKWTTPGGDFDATPSASKSAHASGFYTFSDPQLTADVQGWLADPASNFGWMLIGNETTRGTAVRFDTREASAANRPALAITFTVPEPTGFLWL